jgi:hypothetical protein
MRPANAIANIARDIVYLLTFLIACVRELPTAVEVTAMAPPATPTRAGIRIQRRCIELWRRIDGIFFDYYWRWRYDDRAPNHVSFTNERGRLFNNRRGRTSILVARNFAVARLHRQICGDSR